MLKSLYYYTAKEQVRVNSNEMASMLLGSRTAGRGTVFRAGERISPLGTVTLLPLEPLLAQNVPPENRQPESRSRQGSYNLSTGSMH
jgi:hypothetical protein